MAKNCKKKIGFIIPTLTGGGMERVVSELANFFSNQGHEVHVVFLVKHEIFYVLNHNIKIYFPHYELNPNFLSRLCFRPKAVLYIRKHINNIKPDTVFSMPQGYNNLSILALLGLGIPIYVSDRSSPLKNIGFINSTLRKLLYPIADGIIAQTTKAKEILLKSGIKNNNIIVIPNPLKKINSYNGSIRKIKNRIISTGRLVPEKNFKELIEIFHQTNIPDWELYILGEGPLRNDLDNFIKKLNLEESVFLPGTTSDIDNELGKAEIFAFTSISEGFPNSLSEAMAFPLACISYDCIAGPSDLIQNNVNGILIEKGNIVSFTAELKRLMGNPKLRCSLKENSIHGRIKYNINKIGQQYLDFILGETHIIRNKQ